MPSLVQTLLHPVDSPVLPVRRTSPVVPRRRDDDIGVTESPLPVRLELATILFTDIADSTRRAAALGDGAWRRLLDAHDVLSVRAFETFRGRAVRHTGDGYVAVFDSPRAAIDCALVIRNDVRRLRLRVRAGVHTGEFSIRGDDVAGVAVHIAARVAAIAGADQLLITSAARSALPLDDQRELRSYGCRHLKGLSRPVELSLFVGAAPRLRLP